MCVTVNVHSCSGVDDVLPLILVLLAGPSHCQSAMM